MDCPSRAATRANQGVCLAQKAVGGRTDFRLADALSAIGQGLRATARNFGDADLLGDDPHHGQALGVKSDLKKLFKHPLRKAANFKKKGARKKLLPDGAIRWNKGAEFLIERDGKIVTYGEND